MVGMVLAVRQWKTELTLSVLEVPMRSELIFGSIAHVPNRFLLTKLLAKATRAMHAPGTRIEDTTNAVLAHFGRCNPLVNLQRGGEPPVPVGRSKPGSTITRSTEPSTLAPCVPLNASLEAARVLVA
jgi:hypothetical protein